MQLKLFLTSSECAFTYSQVSSVMGGPPAAALWIALRWPTPGR